MLQKSWFILFTTVALLIIRITNGMIFAGKDLPQMLRCLWSDSQPSLEVIAPEQGLSIPEQAAMFRANNPMDDLMESTVLSPEEALREVARMNAESAIRIASSSSAFACKKSPRMQKQPLLDVQSNKARPITGYPMDAYPSQKPTKPANDTPMHSERASIEQVLLGGLPPEDFPREGNVHHQGSMQELQHTAINNTTMAQPSPEGEVSRLHAPFQPFLPQLAYAATAPTADEIPGLEMDMIPPASNSVRDSFPDDSLHAGFSTGQAEVLLAAHNKMYQEDQETAGIAAPGAPEVKSANVLLV